MWDYLFDPNPNRKADNEMQKLVLIDDELRLGRSHLDSCSFLLTKQKDKRKKVEKERKKEEESREENPRSLHE